MQESPIYLYVFNFLSCICMICVCVHVCVWIEICMCYHVLPCAYEGQRTISHISPCLKPCLTKDLLLMAEHTRVASPQISKNYLVLVCNLTERTLGYRCVLWYPACMSSKNQNQILSHWPRNHSVKGKKGGEKPVWKRVLKTMLPGVTQRIQECWEDRCHPETPAQAPIFAHPSTAVILHLPGAVTP